jgi:hypothetical protein
VYEKGNISNLNQFHLEQKQRNQVDSW